MIINVLNSSNTLQLNGHFENLQNKIQKIETVSEFPTRNSSPETNSKSTRKMGWLEYYCTFLLEQMAYFQMGVAVGILGGVYIIYAP